MAADDGVRLGLGDDEEHGGAGWVRASQRAGEDSLWLGVCVYTEEEEPEGEPTAQARSGEVRAVGFAHGLVNVYHSGKLQYAFLGHGGLCVRGVWIVLLGNDIILVSIDVGGTVCWWELEKGQCLFKRKYGRNAGTLRASAFVPDKQYLCIVMSRTASTIAVVDAETRSLLYEVGGTCIRSIECSDPTPSQPCRLLCELESGQLRTFDFESMAFAPLEADRDAVLSPSRLDLVSEEIARFDNRVESWGLNLGRMHVVHVVQLGSSEVFLCLEQDISQEIDNANRPNRPRRKRRALRAYRANELPWCASSPSPSTAANDEPAQTKATDASQGASGSDDDASGRGAQREDGAAARRPPPIAGRRQVITCKPAPDPSWDRHLGSARAARAARAVPAPASSKGEGEDESGGEVSAEVQGETADTFPGVEWPVRSGELYHVLVAASNSSILSLFELDLSSLATTFLLDFRINLQSVDAMSISPFSDGKLCIVDEFFDKALVILNDTYEQVYRVYLGPASVDTNALRWASPFQVELGNDWSFDLISERVLKNSTLYTSPYVFGVYPPAPPSVLEQRSTPPPPPLQQQAAAENRRRTESSSSSSSMAPIPGIRSSGQLTRARPYDASLACGPGISFLEPSQGLKIWTLHMHEIKSCTASLLALMSFFLEWGLDADVDAQVERVLRVRAPSHDRFRFLVHALPSADMYVVLADNSRRWLCSDRFTASQTLGLISLFISLLASDSLDERQQALMSSLVSHYGIVFPERLISERQYMFPCLDMMSQFVLSNHASEDVHVAARLLLQVSVERMPVPLRVTRTAQWAARLHLSNGMDRHAVVVLGMMGVTHPEDLAPATARLVAVALRRFVAERNSEDTIVAAELLARGFYVWCPYIDDLSGLISDLIMTLDLAGPFAQRPTDAQAQAQASVGQQPTGVVSSTATGCQRALFEIANAQPLVFIETVGRDALRSGRHRQALTALSKFIKRHPVTLLRHLPAVVEIVIKTLDPSESEIRKACLKFSTVVLHQLVKRYPMVSFHQQSQRFAVGTVESIILIYDLRTATKWRILEGHVGPVSAVELDPANGERMVSYAAQESALRVWNTGGGTGFFSGLLGIQGSCQRVVKLPRLRTGAQASAQSTASDVIHNCKLDWNRLVREDGKTRVDLTALWR